VLLFISEMSDTFARGVSAGRTPLPDPSLARKLAVHGALALRSEMKAGCDGMPHRPCDTFTIRVYAGEQRYLRCFSSRRRASLRTYVCRRRYSKGVWSRVVDLCATRPRIRQAASLDTAACRGRCLGKTNETPPSQLAQRVILSWGAPRQEEIRQDDRHDDSRRPPLSDPASAPGNARKT